MGEKTEVTQGSAGIAAKVRPTIAFLTHSISDEYGGQLWRGAMEAASERGANLICYPGWAPQSPLGFEAQANIIYELISADTVNGVVFSSGVFSEFVGRDLLAEFYDRYKSPKLKRVSIAVQFDGIPSVVVENYLGICEVMTHLIETHGLSRIAFITSPKPNPEAQDRYRGYKDMLAKYGLKFNSNLVTEQAEWREDAGRAAVRELIDKKGLKPEKDFQAIVAGNDNLAYGALVELESRAIKVPEGVALTGFDDQERSGYLNPALTTVFQPVRELGRQAVKMALEQIEGKEVEEIKELHVDFRVRQSCGCPNVIKVEKEIKTNPGTTGIWKLGLASLRDDIKKKINDAMGDIPPEIAAEQTERLVNALYKVLNGDTSEVSLLAFLSTLYEILSKAMQANGDLYAWQTLMANIRGITTPYIGTGETAPYIQEFWRQTQSIIGKKVRQTEGYRKLLAEQGTAALVNLSRSLLTITDEADLKPILSDGLPSLKIPGCYISLYENPAVPSQGCNLILAYKKDIGCFDVEPGQMHFPSVSLVPIGLLPKDKSYSLIIEPLYFQENQLGIAVFEVGSWDGWVYDTLRGELSSALWARRLIQISYLVIRGQQ